MNRQNRRARTLTYVQNNHIFGVTLYVNGYIKKVSPFYFARKMHNGTVYTGPVTR